jgi:AraC-like DNA-binding protein
MKKDMEDIHPMPRLAMRRTMFSSGVFVKHFSKNHNLELILKGSVTFVVNGVPYHLQTGNIAYIPSGVWKQISLQSEETMVSYSCLFNMNRSAGNEPLPFPVLVQQQASDHFTRLFQNLINIWLVKNDGFMIRSKAYLMLMIAELSSPVPKNSSGHVNVHVEKVKTFINDRVFETLTIQQIADYAGIHQTYLCSLFRKHTGFTLKEYIMNLKIQRAKDFLEMNEYKIGEIAFLCGFQDTLYFSKVFKKVAGMSPSEYIRNPQTRLV